MDMSQPGDIVVVDAGGDLKTRSVATDGSSCRAATVGRAGDLRRDSRQRRFVPWSHFFPRRGCQWSQAVQGWTG